MAPAATGPYSPALDPTHAGTLPTQIAQAPARAERRMCKMHRPRAQRAPSSSVALPSDVVQGASARLSYAMLVVAVVDLVYVLLYLTVWTEYADMVGTVVGG